MLHCVLFRDVTVLIAIHFWHPQGRRDQRTVVVQE
jgi:hypothetical protein